MFFTLPRLLNITVSNKFIAFSYTVLCISSQLFLHHHSWTSIYLCPFVVHIFSTNNCCILPVYNISTKTNMLKLHPLNEIPIIFHTVQTKYSSSAIQSCIPCNSIQYKRKLYIRSSNVKKFWSPPHLLVCKRNMQYYNLYLIYVSLFQYSTPLVHYLFQLYLTTYIWSNIFHKLFNIHSNVKYPSIIFNIMSYVKYIYSYAVFTWIYLT